MENIQKLSFQSVDNASCILLCVLCVETDFLAHPINFRAEHSWHVA